MNWKELFRFLFWCWGGLTFGNVMGRIAENGQHLNHWIIFWRCVPYAISLVLATLLGRWSRRIKR